MHIHKFTKNSKNKQACSHKPKPKESSIYHEMSIPHPHQSLLAPSPSLICSLARINPLDNPQDGRSIRNQKPNSEGRMHWKLRHDSRAKPLSNRLRAIASRNLTSNVTSDFWLLARYENTATLNRNFFWVASEVDEC